MDMEPLYLYFTLFGICASLGAAYYASRVAGIYWSLRIASPRMTSTWVLLSLAFFGRALVLSYNLLLVTDIASILSRYPLRTVLLTQGANALIMLLGFIAASLKYHSLKDNIQHLK